MTRPRSPLAIIVFAALLGVAATNAAPTKASSNAPERRTPTMVKTMLEPVRFEDLPGWPQDSHAQALKAFTRHCAANASPPRTGELGVDGAALRVLCVQARDSGASRSDDEARRFFETYFEPMRIKARGFLTGYFEPELRASRIRTKEFTTPLLRPPAAMIRVTEENRPKDWDPAFSYGLLRADGGLARLPNRGQIMDGALSGQGLELAWLADPVDAFYIHVQGSARLSLPDGDSMRVGFAGKSGHPYFPIGRVMIERNLAAPGTVTMDVLRDWLARNPEEVSDVLRRNPSYIFFQEIIGENPDSGPIGAAGLPLIDGRSLAVDAGLHTFGAPIFVSAHLPMASNAAQKTFQRLMIAEDTGSAIKGPARGDLFIGSGAAAGVVAGRIQHKADLTILVPRRRQAKAEARP